MGKDCGCVTAQSELNKPRYNTTAIANTIVSVILVLSISNSIIPYFLPNWWPTGYFIPLGYVLSAIIIIAGSRSMLVGTCCLPDLQITGQKLLDIIESRDKETENRILQNKMKYAQTLSKALQCKTISYDVYDTKNKVDYDEFLKLHALIEDSYPLVHKHLEKTVINNYSLVYKWTGKQDATTVPYLLTAHLDVVPTPDLDQWEVEPFSGKIDLEYIWGRGAIDDKQNVFSILESVEDLIQSGFTPQRTVYLAFGHDEEISGWDGAHKIAEHFTSTLGPNCFEFICDEGLFIIDGTVPNHKKPVAFVCIAEKGAVSLELSVNVNPGHASAPPKETAIGILSNALAKLEANPMPAHFDGPANNVFNNLRAGFHGYFKFIMSNLWLFAPILRRILAASPLTATLVRTTTALTIVNAGEKVNVLPAVATACVNHRIHPNDSIQKVIDWDTKVINDPRVKIRILDSIEPAPVSDPNHDAYKSICVAIHQTFQDSCSIVPGLFVANSDSRHYWNVSSQIYRFNPITLHSSEVGMFHGFNERIRINDYARLIVFWRNLIVLNDSRLVTKEQQGKLMVVNGLNAPSASDHKDGQAHQHQQQQQQNGSCCDHTDTNGEKSQTASTSQKAKAD